MPIVTQYLSQMVRLLVKHRHFFIVVTLLTLATTYPAIVYVFKTDVFWHAAGAARDVYIEHWDVWYGGLFLTGRADPYHTNLTFYPKGVSLNFTPFNLPHIIAVNVLHLFLPISNAFNLAFLLIIWTSALSAYIYLLWLFKDRWVSLFGAVVFGFAPLIVGNTFNLKVASMATAPLILYCFHRGATENRRVLTLAAGLLTGLTSVIILYQYVCVLILLGCYSCALAFARWRDKRYWLNVMLLVLSVSASSFWRVYPMISDAESLGEAVAWHGPKEIGQDLVSSFVNHSNPFLGALLSSAFAIDTGKHFIAFNYLGYLPLLLIAAGFFTKGARRKMLPWAVCCLLFLVLRLGSRLTINGVEHSDILLPKHYLDQIFPAVFETIRYAYMFMIGALMPFAVLACYGLVALQKRLPIATRPIFVLALVLIVAFEYYIPVSGWLIPDSQLDYLEWLKREGDADEIRLINLPMGRTNAKRHGLHQALSGFIHVEGAISRTPDSAYDYIRGNTLLNHWAWEKRQPVHCDMPEREAYMASLAQLENDGFSHIVYHQHEGYYFWEDIKASFDGFEPAYSNGAVSVYRLSDIRESCMGERSAEHHFTRAQADAIKLPAPLDERQGALVVLPPTAEAGAHFMRYLRHFSQVERTVVTVVWDDEAVIDIHDPEYADPNADLNPEHFAALWLVNAPPEYDAAQTAAWQEWLAKRFTFCQRVHADERATIDLYLRADIPCAAMDESSAIEVAYDSGVRLHKAAYDLNRDKIRFYLAWTNHAETNYGFSLQFFDGAGEKALQYDDVIYQRQLLTPHEIDASALAQGVYAVKLIVYDFETRKSVGGALTATGERFERELEIASIEISR